MLLSRCEFNFYTFCFSLGRVYVSPIKLRKRTETSAVQNQKYYEPNTEAMGVELHKDSKFYQSWQDFR